MSTVSTTARLEARISLDLHTMLKRAAEIEGRTMTDFVIGAVKEAAQLTIAQSDVMRLSLNDQLVFANAILAPTPANGAMQRALARHRTRVVKSGQTGDTANKSGPAGDTAAN